MDAENSKQLIESLGGTTTVAKALGYDIKGGVQRVNNWKRRGIPPKVILDHPNVFRLSIKQKKAA